MVSAEANASNTLVLKPEVGVWYDVTDVTRKTAAGADRRKARADQFIVKVELVYSLF